ncbi:hypothetical protein V3468_00050 [Flavobacterium oreochromis]|uniref:hypothetical protein n=1 Tax=Flavobacterium oreochromis TaxID=2906078 RepID=UPI00385BCB93
MWGKLLRSLFLLLSFSSIAQTITDIQIQNARATGYAIIAAKNPGVRFSVMVIPWDKEKTLEQNANNQINPYWHAQCAVKGNYFDQPFDGANFSAYSSVVTSQEEFDLYKSTGTQWWIVCSDLPSFSVSGGSPVASVIRKDYGSPNAGALDFGDGTGWKFNFRRKKDNVNLVTFQDNGLVGIGTATPLATLDVNGNGIFNQRDSDYTHIRLGHNINDNIISDNSSSKYYGGGYFFRVHNETIPHKYIDALFLGENGNIGVGAKALNHKLEVSGNASINGILFVQGADLKLGMGDGRDQGTLVEQRALVHGSADQLWVNYGGDFEGGTKIGNGIILKNSGDSAFQGKIEAKELKVTTTPTADFVFDERYDLPKLETVEKHIKEKKHLPEVASAKEMEKNGVNVGDFQIKLLQKIEELTLYVIEQNKKIQALQTEIKELKK